MKQELIVTRLSHRLGLRQETVWARYGELMKERKQKEARDADRRPSEPPPMEPDRFEDEPPPANGARHSAELQLLDLLLGHPEFVATAAPVIAPDEIQHSGMRRMLVELYAIHAAGQTPDMDILRERLHDRADLFKAAERRRDVGLHMTEPEREMTRISKWFVNQKKQQEERSLTSKLKGGSLNHDEAAELLRKLQQRRTG